MRERRRSNRKTLKANRALRCVCALLAIFFSLAPAGAGPNCAYQEIAPGVFAHQGETAMMSSENFGGIANLGAIVGEASVAVVDTGGSLLQGRACAAALREKTRKPIRYVINTHAHPDHVFGNGAFVGDGVVFIGHKNLPRALATRGEHYLASFRDVMGHALDGVTIIPPTLTVGTTMTLDLGGREIVLQAWTAAHTDADLTVLDTKTGTLFAGDLLFLQHVPVVDASLLGFLDLADRLAAIRAERAVPGHGPLPASWPKSLEDERAYLSRLTKDLRASIKKGATVGDAAAAAGAAEREKWRLFENYHARNATAGFAELEWEGP